MASTEQAFQYILSFIVGKDQGREFPLPPDLHIVIGRISDVDLLILDEGVSRKHAKISSHGGKIVISDLGSKNGTFVNGERVLFTELKAGDEIGIGTSMIKLVSLDGAAAQLPSLPLEPSQYEVALPMETTPPIIAGSIREMPLADLLQLFSYSRKSGVLTVRSGQAVGKIYISDGQVRSAGIEDNPAMDPHRAFYRIFAWADGVFDLRPLAGRAVAEDMPRNDNVSGAGSEASVGRDSPPGIKVATALICNRPISAAHGTFECWAVSGTFS